MKANTRQIQVDNLKRFKPDLEAIKRYYEKTLCTMNKSRSEWLKSSVIFYMYEEINIKLKDVAKLMELTNAKSSHLSSCHVDYFLASKEYVIFYEDVKRTLSKADFKDNN